MPNLSAPPFQASYGEVLYGGPSLYWLKDIGDPKNPKHAAFLLDASSFHGVKRGTSYPSTLVLIAENDQQVVPQHAFKLVEALQEAQAGPGLICLRVARDAGHILSTRSRAIVEEEAVDMLSFLHLAGIMTFNEAGVEPDGK